MNLTIKQKILLGFGIAIFFSLIVAAVSVYSLQNNQIIIKHIISKQVTYLRLVEECKTMVLQIRRFEKDVFLNIGTTVEQDKCQDKLKNAIANCEYIMDSLEVVTSDLTLPLYAKNQLTISKQCITQYKKDLIFVIDSIKKNQVSTSQDANKLMTNYKTNIHLLESTTDSLKNSGIMLLVQTGMNENSNARFKITILISVIAVSIISIFLFGIFFATSISRSIRFVTIMLKDISDGEIDLTKRLKVKSKDEIGELAGYFNKFVDKLQGIIDSITKSANTIASSATELSAVSTQIASSAEEMSTQTSTVASSTEQATNNINSISSATEEMSSSTEFVATAIEEMSASLNEVSRNCQKELQIATVANTHAKSGKEVMDRLGVAAKSIGKIVEVINDIADQTNLLALNATIEAASAGDAGKGFAVVASEVKDLAKQTAQATQEIEKEIEQMQSNTQSAVKAIEAVSNVIEEVNAISQTIVSAVEEQSATVTEIARNVNSVSISAQNVSKNVLESAKGLSDVSAIIAGVNGAVTETSKGIVHVKSSADDVAKMSETLKSLLSQFKH